MYPGARQSAWHREYDASADEDSPRITAQRCWAADVIGSRPREAEAATRSEGEAACGGLLPCVFGRGAERFRRSTCRSPCRKWLHLFTVRVHHVPVVILVALSGLQAGVGLLGGAVVGLPLLFKRQVDVLAHLGLPCIHEAGNDGHVELALDVL